jgi:hypothetical protein
VTEIMRPFPPFDWRRKFADFAIAATCAKPDFQEVGSRFGHFNLPNPLNWRHKWQIAPQKGCRSLKIERLEFEESEELDGFTEHRANCRFAMDESDEIAATCETPVSNAEG